MRLFVRFSRTDGADVWVSPAHVAAVCPHSLEYSEILFAGVGVSDDPSEKFLVFGKVTEVIDRIAGTEEVL